MHSFLCFSKIGFLHDIDLYLDSLSLEICDFDSKQFSLPVAISACRAAPMGANPLGHTFKPLTLYDISIYTIYFSHPKHEILQVPQAVGDNLFVEKIVVVIKCIGFHFVSPLLKSVFVMAHDLSGSASPFSSRRASSVPQASQI